LSFAVIAECHCPVSYSLRRPVCFSLVSAVAQLPFRGE
jgi:hypothetical protein